MKPNIILIMTDQQRADLRKSCGYPLDTMPFLDSWAKGGADFRMAYTANPTCMPARVSMFTGRYSGSHRVRTNHNEADAYYTQDLLDLLRKHGYRTALCGKNHSHRKPEDFDFFECNGHQGNEEGEDKTPDEISFGKWLNYLQHMESHKPSPGRVELQHPYRNVSSALRFIDGTARGTPFFIWLSIAEPHSPYQVPDPYFNMFEPNSLPALTTGTQHLSFKGPRFEWLRHRWEDVLAGDIDQRILRVRSNYHGMLRLIDDQFKRLIQGLESRNLTDDTLVVFLSDHGDFVGEYGLIRKGGNLAELLIRIPMIWRGPGITPQGEINSACVNIVDLLPTICDLLQINSPLGCQGRSILPLLQNRDIPPGEFDVAYCENGFSGLYWDEKDNFTPLEEGAMGKDPIFFDCLNTWTQCGQVRMVRKGDYKLQMDMMGTGYLYNLSEDPLELNNLWNEPSYLQIKTYMLELLSREMLRQCDSLPYPRRRYRVKLHPMGYWDQTYNCGDTGVSQAPEL
ncbi:MAG: sulfatase-like hydrolase/transferase [Clostridiales bacterium]|jgi:arylsulfatase A-like enzyme|nr:sulfatase-like hydrolase/transferase [Clostridiales bacterium]